MKKNFRKWSVGIAAALALTAGGMGVASAAITEEQAKSIAIEHAGLAASDVDYVRARPDFDDGRLIYEVEFYAGDREYDYDIAREDGEILKSDYEVHRRGRGYRSEAGQQMISYEDAAAKALARVEGATERNLHLKRDRSHGRPTFEGEIFYDGYEYEFEIDAVTGEFLEWKAERKNFW